MLSLTNKMIRPGVTCIYCCSRSFFLLLFFLLSQNVAVAQIWVESLSRTDTFAILGSGSDNHILIHNLPSGAIVSISIGTAIELGRNEYMLCRFGDCGQAKVSAKLSVRKNDSILFLKEYKITHTEPSGSIYNPKLYIRLGHPRNSTDFRPGSDTIRFEDFNAALNEGLFLSDTSFHLVGLMFGIDVCVDGDFYGTHEIGLPVECGHLPLALPTDAVLRKQVQDKLKYAKRHSSIFLDGIVATGPGGGLCPIGSKVIYIR